MSVAGFPAASSADLARSHLKDSEAISHFQKLVQDLPLPTNVLPPSILDSISTFLCYLFSFRQSSQTLGQEYTALIPITEDHVLPKRSSFIILAFVNAFGFKFAIRLLRELWRVSGTATRGHVLFPEESAKLVLEWLSRLHTAVFYLWGRYYDVGSRIAGLRYVSLAGNRMRNREEGRNLYQILGVLLISRLGVEAWVGLSRYLRRWRRRSGILEGIVKRSETGGEEEDIRPGEVRRKCTLCLGRLKDPALTRCGHVFCWNCVAGWCAEKEICPLCRSEVQIKSLVCLYNIVT